MGTFFAFFSIWRSPQGTIKELTQTYSLLNDLQALFFLTFGLIIQAALFIWLVDVIPSAHFLSLKGIETIAWITLGIGIGVYTYTNITALLTWKIATLLKGQGSLAATRTGILWGLICCLPVGLSLLFIYFTYSQRLLGQSLFPIDFASLLTLPLTVIYGFVVSIYIISAIHSFSLFRSILTVSLCLMVQGIFVVGLIELLRT